MNSYEFIQAVHKDEAYLRMIFDSSMALYQVLGTFNSVKVIDTQSSTVAMQYTIAGDAEYIKNLIANLSGYVTTYGHTYLVTVSSATADTLTIMLQDTNPGGA